MSVGIFHYEILFLKKDLILVSWTLLINPTVYQTYLWLTKWFLNIAKFVCVTIIFLNITDSFTEQEWCLSICFEIFRKIKIYIQFMIISVRSISFFFKKLEGCSPLGYFLSTLSSLKICTRYPKVASCLNWISIQISITAHQSNRAVMKNVYKYKLWKS